MQVVVDDLLTTYSQIGKGKTNLLLLHGWADSGKTFEMLSKDLAKEDKNLSITYLDLPGFGGTQIPKQAWGLEEYASFVSNFLNKINLKIDVIIGHSNGGAIAINGLASGKLNAQKLILLASAGIRKPSAKKAFLRVASVPVKIGLKLLPGQTRQKVRQKFYGAIGSDYLVVEDLRDTFKRVVTSDVSEDAAKLAIPVCLIYGSLDNSTPVDLGKELASVIPDSQFKEIPDTGHFVHQEQVYKVSKMIRDFIK